MKRCSSRYPRSLAPDRQLLFSRYELVDIALKVVGVGSIGSRCGIALYRTTAGEPLVLQVKEAKRSVLERFAEAEAMPSRAAFDEPRRSRMQAAEWCRGSG